MPVQYTAWVVVDPVYYFLYAAGGYLAEVGTFWKKPSYHLVLLLVAAALAWVSRVAVVQVGALVPAGNAAFHARAVHKLMPVVHGDALEYLFEPAHAVLAL